jgi:hypothetical protein
MALPTQTDLENAQLDVVTISEFVNNTATQDGGNVTNRNNVTFRNLARINQDIADAGDVSFERVTVDRSSESENAFIRARAQASFTSGYRIYDRSASAYRDVLIVNGTGELEVGAITWGTQTLMGDWEFNRDFGSNIGGTPLTASSATDSLLWDQSLTRLAIATANAPSLSLNRTSDASPNGVLVEIRANGTVIGTISGSGSTTSYNTSSDYRLKDAKDVPKKYDPVSVVGQLRDAMRWYSWKNDPAKDAPGGDERAVELGWFAHELGDIEPMAVSGEKDASDENGLLPQGRDDTKLIPHLVAALGKLIDDNRDLRARVDQLEAGA